MKPERLYSFWNYYGGKWRLARRYDVPIYNELIEPFAGAAGYALNHYQKQVILVDKDPVIVAVWKWLIAATHDDVMSLPLLGPEDKLDELDIPDGARWFIGFQLRSGSSYPANEPSSWMKQVLRGEIGRSNPSRPTEGSFWGERRRKRAAEQVQWIKHWHMFGAGYEYLPNGRATWFVDPPYQGAGKHYKHGSKNIDFENLGAWCKERHGQVIVCENEGADWLPFESFTEGQATPRSKKGRVSKECVWKSET